MIFSIVKHLKGPNYGPHVPVSNLIVNEYVYISRFWHLDSIFIDSFGYKKFQIYIDSNIYGDC